MAIAAEQCGRETLATTVILDGDVHLNESPAELAEYAEPPWDIALREIAAIGGGHPATGPPHRRARGQPRARHLQHRRRAACAPQALPASARTSLQRSTSGTREDGAETGWKLTWTHEGEIVTCPWHGLDFHVPTGQCLAWPEIRLRTCDVAVVDGEIEVVL